MILLKVDFMFRAVLGLQQIQAETTESIPPLHTNSSIHTSHCSAIGHSMGFHIIVSDRLVSMPPNFSELNLFILSYTSSLAITDLFIAVIVLSFSRISNSWNHTEYSFFRLASFIEK